MLFPKWLIIPAFLYYFSILNTYGVVFRSSAFPRTPWDKWLDSLIWWAFQVENEGLEVVPRIRSPLISAKAHLTPERQARWCCFYSQFPQIRASLVPSIILAINSPINYCVQVENIPQECLTLLSHFAHQPPHKLQRLTRYDHWSTTADVGSPIQLYRSSTYATRSSSPDYFFLHSEFMFLYKTSQPSVPPKDPISTTSAFRATRSGRPVITPSQYK